MSIYKYTHSGILMMGVTTYACIDKTHPSFELLRYVCMYVCTYVCLSNYIQCQNKVFFDNKDEA